MSGPVVADLGEAGILARITPLLPSGRDVLVGPGDDCAVLAAPDGRYCVSTDVLVEGRHFRTDWSSGFDVGARAAAQNLADIAAMGARPVALVACLVLPGATPVDWVVDLARGMALRCREAGAAIVGGDLSAGEGLVVAVTVHGDLRGRAPVLRSGARAGEALVLAGTPGRSAAGLALLEAGWGRSAAGWDSRSGGGPAADSENLSVADGVAESGRAEGSRRTALSGPRTTARLLACLPPVGLVLGAMIGARPEEILLDGGWGSALGAAGVALMVVGHRATGRLVRAAEADGEGVDEALVLDLAAAALEAGASVPGALVALGRALGEGQAEVVGRALLLGSGWEEAWRAPQDEAWRERRSRLDAGLRPGWEDGASPGPLLAGTAASLRAGRAARDQEAAERLAVRLVVPLGACHLPAFVILGIVPVVASVGLDLLRG